MSEQKLPRLMFQQTAQRPMGLFGCYIVSLRATGTRLGIVGRLAVDAWCWRAVAGGKYIGTPEPTRAEAANHLRP